MHVHIYIHIYIYTHRYIYIYIHTHTHTYEGNSNPFLCSYLVNSMTGEPGRLQFIGVTKSQTQVSMHAHVYTHIHTVCIYAFPGDTNGKEPCFQCRFDPWVGMIPWIREGMATHSSILAWRTPWIEELGRLQSMGLQRVGHK